MLELKQAISFAHSLDGGRIRLPKFAIYGKQVTQGKSSRFVWVDDPRICGYASFRVRAMDCNTGEVYSFLVSATASYIGRAFARYADSLPLDRIHAPVWRASSHDANLMGPHDRRPQPFNAHRSRPARVDVIEDRSVIDGCVIGHRKYREEGYNHVFLGL